MSVSMYFLEILGSSKYFQMFYLFVVVYFFFWVGFRATDAGLLSESESFECLPQIAKKNLKFCNSGRGGEREEAERGQWP